MLVRHDRPRDLKWFLAGLLFFGDLGLHGHLPCQSGRGRRVHVRAIAAGCVAVSAALKPGSFVRANRPYEPQAPATGRAARRPPRPKKPIAGAQGSYAGLASGGLPADPVTHPGLHPTLGAVGAIFINLGSCGYNRKLDIRRFERLGMWVIGGVMAAIWITIAVTNVSASPFLVVMLSGGMALRSVAKLVPKPVPVPEAGEWAARPAAELGDSGGFATGRIVAGAAG